MRVLHTVRHVLAVITAAVLMINVAHARTPRISLDDDTVRAFIGSFAHVKRKIEEGSAGESNDGFASASAPVATMLASVRSADLNCVVQSHGFRDFDTWKDTLAAIARAYSFTVGSVSLQQRGKRAETSLDREAWLSGEQRSGFAKQLHAAVQIFSKARPPQRDLDAVVQHIDALAALFGGGSVPAVAPPQADRELAHPT